MPTYEYQCGDCGTITDRSCTIAERNVAPACSSCGSTNTERGLFTPATVKFNGPFSGGTSTKDMWAFKGKRSPKENKYEAKKNAEYKREQQDRKRKKFVADKVREFDI